MTTFVRNPGRRGGLAVHPVPASYAPPAGARAAGLAASLGSAASRLREPVRWTLIFAAFFAFTGGVISSRIQVGTPLMIAGVIGLLLQRESLRWGTVTPLLALWTAWSAVGLVGSEYPDAVWLGLDALLKLLVITLVGVNALRTRAQLRVYSVFALFAFLLYPGRGSFIGWVTGANVVFGRALWNGVYGNPNDLASITLLLLSVAAGLVATERARLTRLAALGVTGFLTFIIFITQSRGVLVALGVFVVAVLWRMPGKQRLRAGLTVVALGAAMVVFAPASVWDRLSGLRYAADSQSLTQVDAEGSATQRYEIWKVARTIVAEHPIFGVGLGAYKAEHARTAVRPDFKPTARGARDTHSTYLNVAAETGLPGLVLFLAIVLATVWGAEQTRRLVRARDPVASQQLLLLEMGLVAYMIAGVWGSYAKLNMLYLHMVLLWATSKVLREEHTTPRSSTPLARR
jgi:O-antigen ligase